MTAGNRLIIAIDGPAGSGKSTTARLLAARLGYLYIDTGAMYRAATLHILRSGIDPQDRSEVAAAIEGAAIVLEPSVEGVRVFLDGEDVSDEIRSSEVTRTASAVSEVPRVREVLVAAQQRMGAEGGVVLEGRDIGTVVFPEADLKIYLIADVHERAVRRQAELISRGVMVELAEVESDLERRDAHDSGREHSPLRRADDAIEVDTTALTIQEQVARIEELALTRLKST